MSEYGSATRITLEDLHTLGAQVLAEIHKLGDDISQLRTQRPATSRAVRDFRSEIEAVAADLLALTNRVEQIEQQLRAWRVGTP